jgi:hypothetical protein
LLFTQPKKEQLILPVCVNKLAFKRIIAFYKKNPDTYMTLELNFQIRRRRREVGTATSS